MSSAIHASPSGYSVHSVHSARSSGSADDSSYTYNDYTYNDYTYNDYTYDYTYTVTAALSNQSLATATAAAAAAPPPPVPTSDHPEDQWSNYLGETYYGAGGHRDVMIIVSDDDVNHPDVVPMRPSIQPTMKITAELKEQGVKMGCRDMATLVKGRYDRDPERTVRCIEKTRSGIKVSRKIVLKSIIKIMKDCTDSGQAGRGVILYYNGHGKRDTGDWCFEDGFINFQTLAFIYLQLFRGRVLTVVTDCSHSGQWVKECMAFLDHQGVGPCGHMAREKGILIKVFASCLSHEIPKQLAFFVNGCRNAAGTGLLTYLTHEQVSPKSRLTTDQHALALDVTRLRCGNKRITDKCMCQPQDSWKAWGVPRRFFTLRGFQDRRRVWHILLVADDHRLIMQLIQKTQGENSGRRLIRQWEYGEVLKSGFGKKPYKFELQKWKSRCIKRAQHAEATETDSTDDSRSHKTPVSDTN